ISSCGADQPPSPTEPTPRPPVETPVTIVNVPEIAGKSEAQIAAILGEPISCEDTNYDKKCFYQQGHTEIVFISEKADWITISALDSVPYSGKALPFLGIDESSASVSNSFVMRWSRVPSFLEISIFPAQGHVDYAYI